MQNKNVEMKSSELMYGIALMTLSAIFTCAGQTLWKFGTKSQSMWLYGLGFLFYGVGAILMIFAFRFGEMSVLHPMLSIGFVVSIFVGYYVFNEAITLQKVSGILFIIGGLIIMSVDARRRK